MNISQYLLCSPHHLPLSHLMNHHHHHHQRRCRSNNRQDIMTSLSRHPIMRMHRMLVVLTLFVFVVQSALAFQCSTITPRAVVPLSFSAASTTTLLLSLQSASEDDETPSIFLRAASMADLSYVSKILADGFYNDKNPPSKWWEKIQTQMSLESNLPKPVLQEPHEMWVACNATTGRVVAFCEVDNRPPKPSMPPGEVRPYMCNLAVAVSCRNQGIAQRMIQQCEASVASWLRSSTQEQQQQCLHLKVRQTNEPAVKLYRKMGYDVVSTQADPKNNETLLVMKREWEMEVTAAAAAAEVSTSSSANVSREEASSSR